ncbi:aminoacyl-tRNA hydrolase [Candidatus Parcubacteria bacterium]|nr:aminoacyl-tRNA hydrolase [Candidatus Parcubacteria bacterium]
MFYIVGLGNPGNEYDGSRHNIGREIVEKFINKNDFESFQVDKKNNALISGGEIAGIDGKKTKKEKVMAILPETFMNKSGNSLKKIITSAKKAKTLIVVHDDLDMGIGSAKIVFGKKSGGHKGIDSINRAIKTRDYIRIKIGISPTTPTGKIKKPKGEDKVVKHVLGKFSPKEQKEIKKIEKKTVEVLEQIIQYGYLKAMNGYN